MMIFKFCGFLMFIFSLVTFSLKPKNLLLMLFKLKFIVLSIYFIKFLYFSFLGGDYFFSMVFLTFSLCEGVLGVSVLVSLIRTHGNDYF